MRDLQGIRGDFLKDPSVMSPRASTSLVESVGQTPGRVGLGGGPPTLH
jgi:hypothetical protein